MSSVVEGGSSFTPDSGPVNLDQANPVPKSLPPLRAAIVKDRRFVRFAEMSDPRAAFCRAFNGLDLEEKAVPWPESAGEVFGVAIAPAMEVPAVPTDVYLVDPATGKGGAA